MSKWKKSEQIEHLQSLRRNDKAWIETLESKLEKFTHGGRRIGAGAKKKKKSEKKEPTKVMRIPLSKVAAVLKAIGNSSYK